MRAKRVIFMSCGVYNRLEKLSSKRFLSVGSWFLKKGFHMDITVSPKLKRIVVFNYETIEEKIIDVNDFFTKSSVNFKLLK